MKSQNYAFRYESTDIGANQTKAINSELRYTTCNKLKTFIVYLNFVCLWPKANEPESAIGISMSFNTVLNGIQVMFLVSLTCTK